MEMDLKSIISKIKEEGVEEAEKTASNIVAEAQEKAGGIVKSAEEEKARIIKKAEGDAKRLKENGEEALRQASRDVLLGLRERIVALFDGVVKKEVAEQLTPDTLKKMIIHLSEKFTETGESEIEILLNEKDKSSLEKSFLSSLQGEMKKGTTLKVSPAIENGFRIGEKGKNSYYDFTDDAVTEAFKTFLNPRIIKILDSANNG